MFVCFAMESEVSRVKRARVLSQNQIREIVMDSDSDEEKHTHVRRRTKSNQVPLPEGIRLQSLQT